MRLSAILLLSLCSAACWDFVEPDFPEAGAPAVLSGSTFLDENGRAQISMVLAPGLTVGGLQRGVLNDTLVIFGMKLAPKEVRKNGSREYAFIGDVGGSAISQPFDVLAPQVEGVTRPPAIHWFGIRKAGPDTISWREGTDLILSIDTTLAPSIPAPQIQQWFLDLRGGDRPFRVSSDGLPPANLRVPAEWVLSRGTEVLAVTLTYFQSGQQLSATRDYMTNVSFTVILRWVVKVSRS